MLIISSFRCELVANFTSKISSCGLTNTIDLLSTTNQENYISLNGNQVISSPVRALLFPLVFSTWLWQEQNTDGVIFSFSSESDTVFELISIGSLNQIIFRYSRPIVTSNKEMFLSSMTSIIFSNISIADTDWHTVLLLFSPTLVELYIDGIVYQSLEVPSSDLLEDLIGKQYSTSNLFCLRFNVKVFV